MDLEIRRDRASPFDRSPHRSSAWKIYIDDLAQKGFFQSQSQAEEVRGTESAWAARMGFQYGPDGWNAPGNTAKDVLREPNGKVVGMMSYGYRGRRDMPPGVATEPVGLFHLPGAVHWLCTLLVVIIVVIVVVNHIFT